MKASPPGAAYMPPDQQPTNTLMTITVSQIEAELQTELLTCSECHIPTRTLPAENIPAQALRYGIHCEHVFYMDLPQLHLSNAFDP
jgi:hypothetical protein